MTSRFVALWRWSVHTSKSRRRGVLRACVVVILAAALLSPSSFALRGAQGPLPRAAPERAAIAQIRSLDLAVPQGAGSATVPLESQITITAGGTYSGDWVSTNDVPAVLVSTSEPVTIIDSTVTNVSTDFPLIQAPIGTRVNLTLVRVTGYGGSGRFLEAEGFKSVTVRNCSLFGTGGIYLISPVEAASVKIVRNRVRNIQGGSTLRQFLQFNRVTTATAEVAWNEVVNRYGQSDIEDGISVYKSSNVVIHDNYLQGGYPRHYTWAYSGTGIVLADDGGNFNRAYSNQIVDWTNVGVGIVAGHDNSMTNNRVVSDGRLSDGTTDLLAANVGLVVHNLYRDGEWANNRAIGNTVGWIRFRRQRHDMWLPDAPHGENLKNMSLRKTVSRASELSEYKLWLSKLAAKKIRIGAA